MTYLRRYQTPLSVGLVVLLAALGFVALYHLLHDVHVRDIRAAFHALGPTALIPALLLTAISYVTLTFYDVLALRAIGRRLPYVKAALASFTSYTLSHNLGLSLLTGGSARYRIYAAEGLSLAEVAQVIALASATFWGGVFATTAIACLLWPRSAAIGALGLPPPLLQAIAAAVLLALATLLFLAGRGRRTLCFHRWRLPLPGAPAMLLQLAIGALDLAAASEDQLRSLIAEAAASQADVSIYLPPRADFKLSSQISCSSTVKVTVASSGEGATLDGQEQTGLFYLQGGCSLTLRGLTLVNGRADWYGGVVLANGAGDIEIIDSTVRSCSANLVRHVVLSTALQRRRAAG